MAVDIYLVSTFSDLSLAAGVGVMVVGVVSVRISYPVWKITGLSQFYQLTFGNIWTMDRFFLRYKIQPKI